MWHEIIKKIPSAAANSLGVAPNVSRHMDNFDTTKFFLGRLCCRQHDYQGTGKTLRYKANSTCTECRKFRGAGIPKHSPELEAAGLDTNKVYLGSICRENHQWNNSGKSLRYRTDGTCCKCRVIQWRSPRATQYRRDKLQKNPELLAQQLEQLKEWNKSEEGKRRKQTPEARAKAYERTKQWRKNNPDKQLKLGRKYTLVRRSKKQQVHQGIFSAEDLEKRRGDFDGNCAFCGQPAKSFDHFLSLHSGGSNCLGNLIPTCIRCNKSKQHKHVQDWYPRQPFYSKQRWKKILTVLGKTDGTINQLPLF